MRTSLYWKPSRYSTEYIGPDGILNVEVVNVGERRWIIEVLVCTIDGDLITRRLSTTVYRTAAEAMQGVAEWVAKVEVEAQP